MDNSDCDDPGDMINAPENNQVTWRHSQVHLSNLFISKICLQAIENFQYTKKVVITQQRAHFESEAQIVAPVIKIERQRLESSTSKVHEYELPLDAAWEFPRENLKLGKVSSKQEYNISQKSVSCLLLYTGSGHGKLWQGNAGNCLW